MICAENVTKIYSQGDTSVTALEAVSFSFGENGLVSVIGESGCGKTTLLNLLGGLDHPTEGQIQIDGKPLAEFSEDEWNQFRSERLGFVFQEYNILEELTVEENIQMPLQILDIDKKQKKELVDSVIARLGLTKERKKVCGRLSGGQKQRVAIARAYIKRPDVILADEPTGNLDAENSKNIFQILRELSKDTLVVVITHDSALAQEYSDRVIELSDGRLVSDVRLAGRLSFEVENAAGFIQPAKSLGELGGVLRKLFADGAASCTLRFHSEERKEEASYEAPSKEAHTSRRLSKRELWKMSRRILEKRKVRQAVTVVILSLTIFLLLTALAFASYREDREIATYLKENKIDRIGVCLQTDFVLRSDETTNICVGMVIEQELNKALGESVRIEKQQNGMSLATASHEISFEDKWEAVESRTTSVMGEFATESFFTNYASENEGHPRVVVTDYVANELGLGDNPVGKTLYLQGEKVEVVGVCMTGYESIAFCRLSDRTPNEEYVVLETFNRVWYDENYRKLEEQKQRSEGISVMSNYFFSAVMFHYLSQGMKVGCDEFLSESTLVAGRYPEKKGEIAISSACIEQMLQEGEALEDYIGKTYSLVDLHSESYQKPYADRINLFDYLGEEVCVVGIADTPHAEVLIAKEDFESLFADYMKYYYEDELLIRLQEGNWNAVMAKIHKLGYQVTDPMVSDIYLIGHIKSVIMPYLFLGVLAMLLLTVFLFVSLISFSVQDNRRKIGILRSLGFAGRDVQVLFAIEGMLVTATATILGGLGYFLLLFVIRQQNAVEEVNRVCHLVGYQLPVVLSALLLVNVLSLVFSWLPIRGMNRMELVDVIREAE